VLDTPTVTPVPSLSGPTIEPTATFFADQPTDIPFDEFFQGQNDPTAAALVPDSALPPLEVGDTPAAPGGVRIVEVTALDGTLLRGQLYQGGDVRQPGVLLLAGAGDEWSGFAVQLYEAGFTVLVMPLREPAPLLDFPILLLALSSGEADPASLGVIGAGLGADVALLGCAGDLLCDTVVLLSPTGDPALPNAMPAFNPRPLLLAASEDDVTAFAAAQSIQAAATGEVIMQPFSSAGSGTAMLINRPDLAGLIIQWLQRHIGAP
jgi:hypothetical protein